MPADHFTDHCQGCGGRLKLEKLGCPACGLEIAGQLELPRLARLKAEDREFIELFVLSAGSLKEVGKALNLSYPTVRSRLDRVIEDLRKLDRPAQNARMEIIRKLEAGELSAEEAVQALKRS